MGASVTIISDTHMRHEELPNMKGDLLIHCGDMFNLFDEGEDDFQQMDDWFGQQEFAQIVCTGGNHDKLLEGRLGSKSQPFKNAHYLEDAGFDFGGLRIFGAPWVPQLRSHAFFQPSDALKAKWANIPAGIDILVTHTPPFGILDQSSRKQNLGCINLFDELERISPRIHCFGHVHASAGVEQHDYTRFINACSIESGSGNILKPIEILL